ncbi:XdhC family protein, partial [Planktotalea sp.]|uniref:XdhC family protein n=1 Tax=Planktotalea sp. TaxID=2029877 RepID=UPI00329A7611
MGFELEQLRSAVQMHGRVARVVIADVKGSSPRDVGAAMLVWDTGQSGTIGGGALEFELANRALSVDKQSLTHHALGPELGQCCGGAVQILTEVYEARDLERLNKEVIARSVGQPRDMPLQVRRILTDARATGHKIKT